MAPRIEFTDHAKNRLKERIVSREEVEAVINNPNTTYFDILTERFVSIGSRMSKPGHWLIVVYERRNQLRRVISIIDGTTIEKIARSRVAKGRCLIVR